MDPLYLRLWLSVSPLVDWLQIKPDARQHQGGEANSAIHLCQHQTPAERRDGTQWYGEKHFFFAKVEAVQASLNVQRVPAIQREQQGEKGGAGSCELSQQHHTLYRCMDGLELHSMLV